MREFYAAFIILWIGFALASTAASVPVMAIQSENQGPTIDWYIRANESLTLAWDGAYTGQTEEFWNHTIWINDTDGVDTVLFRYRWSSDTQWTNKTPTHIDGNQTVGLYNSNFTYEVWWDYTLNRPQTEGDGGNFYFQVFANDTLGNWSETGLLHYTGGYMLVSPPPEVVFMSNVLPTLVGALVMVIVIGAVVLVRRRGQTLIMIKPNSKEL